MSMTGAVKDQASAYPAGGRDPRAGPGPHPPTTGPGSGGEHLGARQHPHAGAVLAGQAGEGAVGRRRPSADAVRAGRGRGTRAPPRPPTSSPAAGRGPARRHGGRPRPAGRHRSARSRRPRPRSLTRDPRRQHRRPGGGSLPSRETRRRPLPGRLRGTADRPPADGHPGADAEVRRSVLVHSDGGSYKPLNWMSPPCTVREGPTEDGQVEWLVEAKSGDSLRILIEEILHDSSHDLGVDPGLQKDGVEKHLQELLAEHPATLADGLTLVRREFPTAIGPVDLMCRDAAGASVAVEIKRRGEIDGVEQLTRYLELLNRDPLLEPGARHLRRPGDQAPGPGAGHRPRHRLRRRRLRRPARHGRPERSGCSERSGAAGRRRTAAGRSSGRWSRPGRCGPPRWCRRGPRRSPARWSGRGRRPVSAGPRRSGRGRAARTARRGPRRRCPRRCR